MSRPTVAILGASGNREKFGNKSVRAHVRQGYEVYPVNPRAERIEGLVCYASLAEVPVARLTRICVYLPPAALLETLDEIAAKGCDELFLNPGTESEAVLDKAARLGLDPILACSIVDLGVTPAQFSS
ncbi:MAG: CoA-binding protein [Pirellulales bacterium]